MQARIKYTETGANIALHHDNGKFAMCNIVTDRFTARSTLHKLDIPFTEEGKNETIN